ncbi:OmpA family protein [Pontibacter sp. E15-1]|uniref:OmpA family protein n=1 Tax=Pontibacter sp. E15-1 TaxID=2919918 RepID=UPI001F4F58BC|nr:OmpA family protein [Pontibacter sp. E15-1]MCJ8163924.1 OmpA family protein [Pontibacter sp. E15-1]
MRIRITLPLLLLWLIFGVPVAVRAQDMKQADKYFQNFEFSLALEAYKAILEKGEPNLTVVQRIADSYRILNNSKEAEFWYAQATTFPEADPANTFLYAESAKRNANYGKAKQLFQDYGRKVPAQATLALRMAASCDTALHWMQRPEPFDVKPQRSLNSTGADFSPVKLAEGLLFASDRLTVDKKRQTERSNWTGNGYIQLYIAKATSDSTYAAPVPLPASVNTAYHNGPAVFLEKEQTLYFTRTQVVKSSGGRANSDPTSWFKGSDNGTHTNRHGLYTAVRKGDKWDNVKAFKYNSTSEFSIGHPAITPDGQVLYFVSDMPGGFGETDVYYCERQPDGSWGEPVNAGSAINTSGRESFPSLSAGGTLYFSSDGHLGMGGLDIFKAIGAHKAWTGVENLKYPLNTSHDDFGILADSAGTRGMLSSGRMGQSSSDEIFTFEEYHVPCTLIGRTVERFAVAGTSRKKEEPVARVLLQLTEEGGGTPLEVYSDSNGDFAFQVKAGISYVIRGSKPEYLTQTRSLTPDCRFNTDSLKVEMVFNRSTPNKPIVLDNIFYDLDKYNIRPDAARELDQLVQMLNDNPEIRIELSSHTDSRQSDRYNEMLSQLRAQAASDYVVSRGIDRDRLKAKGYGETRLINRCKDGVSCSETEHQENRRTEFKILR